MVATIEILRTHAASGEPAPAREMWEAAPKRWWHTEPSEVIELIRPLQPSRTSRSCVYLFESPEHGRGRITVSLQGALYRERMDERVQLLELERVLGSREPGRIPDAPVWMTSTRLDVRNPYIQVLFGLIFTGVGTFPFIAPDQDPSLVVRSGFYALGAALVLLGFFGLVCRGLRRASWWHRARAEVHRRGDKMPADLQVFH